LMIGITLLGSTGSIGVSTLDVIAQHPKRFQVVALTADTNVERLFQQCCAHQPQYAVMRDPIAAEQLRAKLLPLYPSIEVLAGAEALEKVAALPEANYVVAAIVGSVGLLPTLAAVRAGKRILLANKETLVMAGAFFVEEVEKHGATLLPVDSEHNALFQCMQGADKTREAVQRIFITASGGPFREMDLKQLSQVTPLQAAAHPVWAMGRKISIDSATMMNKALEVIEAAWLFKMPADHIQVLLHPQSIVHALVEYVDGSVVAQLANPDMRIPIAYTLAWPERITSGVSYLDLLKSGRLDFGPVCAERYPCLQLGYRALATGGTAPAILNAANEVAVQAFVDGLIRFTDIYRVILAVLESVTSQAADTLNSILAADAAARARAQQLLGVLNKEVA
jgi:1-deoxy-D-xylulose-5-phosphate reductoisomerase